MPIRSTLALLATSLALTACAEPMASTPDPADPRGVDGGPCPDELCPDELCPDAVDPECFDDDACGPSAVCLDGACAPGVRCDGGDAAPCNGCPVDTFVPPAWVCAPAGTFEIGADASVAALQYDFPSRTVELTRPLLVSVRPVTRAQWLAVFGDLPPIPAEHETCAEPDCPVAMVSWWDTTAYLNARSHAEGRAPCYRLDGCEGQPGHDFSCRDTPRPIDGCDGYRLPTEAEREAFTRAGTRTLYWSGDDAADLAAVGWYLANAERRVQPTCTPPAPARAHNPWGLCDVHGNVFDWTASGYGPYPQAPDGAPLRDPRGVAGAPTMVVRGGSVHWRIFGLHSAFRVDFPPSERFADVGFRPVRAAERIPPR